MSGRIIEEACLTLPFIGEQFSQEQLETDPDLAALICSTIQTFTIHEEICPKHPAIIQETFKQPEK